MSRSETPNATASVSWYNRPTLEQIGDRVSSIVWLDAFKPENGQRPRDFTTFSHGVMLDDPETLTELLLQAA